MGTGGHGDQRTRNFERGIFLPKSIELSKTMMGKFSALSKRFIAEKNQIKKYFFQPTPTPRPVDWVKILSTGPFRASFASFSSFLHMQQ